MRYKSFTVINYKGISQIDFSISEKDGSIYTLVGLNESGKTTVLESLSLFYIYGKSKESEETLYKSDVQDWHKAIPRGRQDNFNGKISIRARLILDPQDITDFTNLIREKGYSVESNFPGEISRDINFNFKDSVFLNRNNTMGFYLKVKKKGSRKITSLHEGTARNDIWSDIWELVSRKLPPIIYYPNFAFEFPEKIYLAQFDGEDPEQKFYRSFLQDILDSLDNNTNIENHLIARAESAEEKHSLALSSLINKMSRSIDNVLSKHNVFVKQMGNITTRVIAPRKDENGKLYIQIKIVDGDDMYDVKERSLGFRWLFTFVVLTQFRLRRLKGIPPIFLFDEPASNLHQTAQTRLLDSIAELIDKDGSSVIYTTHSHHMINPEWLENAYIVKNRGQEGLDDENFNAKMTDIAVERYRKFVAMNPKQKDYFQPILDVLEYSPSNLEMVPEIVIVEGKFDYYTLKYFINIDYKKRLVLLPGTSASSLDHIVSLYIAWGRNFLVILDGDKEGLKQKERYEKEFGVDIKGRVFILADIDSSFAGKAMEGLISDKLDIQKQIFPESLTYDKTLFNASIQEALSTKRKLTIEKSTKDNLKKIVDFALAQLKLAK